MTKDQLTAMSDVQLIAHLDKIGTDFQDALMRGDFPELNQLVQHTADALEELRARDSLLNQRLQELQDQYDMVSLQETAIDKRWIN